MDNLKNCGDCMENNSACLKILGSFYGLNLPLSRWESVLAEALHSIRSLLCTTTNATPHERFFIFQRRSTTDMSLPSWMTTGSKAFTKHFVRHFKSNPLVDEVQIIHVNPNYEQVRCPNGREMTVSLRNLAPCPQEDTADEEPDSPLTPVNNEEASNLENDLPSEQDEVTPQSDADDESRASPNFVPQRSSRINKGVPPLRYGVDRE